MIVYIAGPFRGETAWDVEQNVRVAEHMSLRLWQAGVCNITPHLLGRHFDKEIEDATILAGTLAIMERCDAVLVLPHYLKSRGTMAEIIRAGELRIPTYYAESAESRRAFNDRVGMVFPYEVPRAVDGIE